MITSSKFKVQSSKLNAGFTLIEILASVIVLVAVGSILAGIISSSLRGANKTNNIENIRQNGNYVINQMSKDIEYALPFDGKVTGLSHDDIAYEANCPSSPLSPSPSPSPSPTSTQYSFITVQSAEGIVTKYNCSGTTSSDSVLKKNGTSLVDGSTTLKSCSLSCIRDKSTDIPIIKIKFELGPPSASSGLAESSSSITFETSVTLRNYKN